MHNNIEGLAKKLESVRGDAMDNVAKEYDKDKIFNELVKKLDDKYTLVYADYRDSYDAETIAKLINTNDPSVLVESIDEWFMDTRYESAMNIIKQTYDEDEIAAIELLDLNDELRYAIEERDDSDIVRDLLRHSSAHFCFVQITNAEPYDDKDEVLESYQYAEDHEAQYKLIAKKSGLSMKDDRKDIVELYENGASFSICPLVWFFAINPLDYYDALMKQYKTKQKDIEVTLHEPHLAIRDSWNGAGHCIATKRTVKVPLSSIKSDEKGNGYSFGIEVCGLVKSAFEIGFTF